MKAPAGFWILSFGEAVLTAGYAVSFPFLAVYLSGHRHMPMSLVGLFLALSLFMTSFAHVIGGELADVFGRKKIMVSALFIRALLIGAIAWVIKADGDIFVLLALHPLGLFVGSFYSPAARAWVADSTPPERRMKVYGILRIGTNAGWAVGPAVGGLMAAGSYPGMFAFTALVYLVCALILTFFIKDSPVFEPAERSGADLRASAATLRDRDFRTYCFFAFAICMVASQLVVSTSLYTSKYLGFDERRIGLLFSVNGTMVVVLQYYVTRVLEKSRITSGLAAGALFYAAGYLMIGYSGAYLYALLGVAVLTIGEVAVSPGLQALGANMAPRREKGRYLGVQGLFQQAGSSAGILLGSSAINFISPHYRQGPWLIVSGLALAAAFGFRALGRRLSPRVDGLREGCPPPPIESPEAI